MVKSKPSFPPEGSELKIPTDGIKGKASKLKKYIGKKKIKINQAWSPRPRLTSRAGVLTWKATILTLDQ